MAQMYTLHPTSPQPRQIAQIAKALRTGAVMLYPTDTTYAIGCDLQAKSAIQRVRHLKQLATGKPLTFLCPSLTDIARYAPVSNEAYRIMRSLIPGPFTFLLPATKLVPQLVLDPKRKTTGIRVPDHHVCQHLLAALENPIISTSAYLPRFEEDESLTMQEVDTTITQVELFDRFDRLVDIILDDGSQPGTQVSTIVDLTEEPTIVRKGRGWERLVPWQLKEARVP
ncbi:L-threonylcarbamoyladenylate synthase [Anthocerotibacter panamensis]|uniref:L-threonylcarbamoyladenylate synthase n=1 Tax=Anthocerotibacter panamensis TaxID=2857077 RepID=UPI001C402E1F|nr:L-threonylcarbamoyladenylate synthase [Anthocerotibacter panamensis]